MRVRKKSSNYDVIRFMLFEECLHDFLLSDSDIAIIKVIAFSVILSQICQKFSIVPRPDLKDIFKFSHGLGDLLLLSGGSASETLRAVYAFVI